MSVRSMWVLAFAFTTAAAACVSACSAGEKASSDPPDSGAQSGTAASGEGQSKATHTGAEDGAGAVGRDGAAVEQDADGLDDPGDASPLTDVADVAPEVYVEPADPVDVRQIQTEVQVVSLEVAAGAIATLEAAPYADVDVPATFTDGSGTVYPSVTVHYRGAYALQNLIQSRATQRNWKVAFPSEQKYRNRREWNFNYEPHVRQQLAYDLMHLAGVRLPSARHVSLVLNGKVQGAYLEFEDPDNKDFLTEQFGDKTGDLFKAAQDTPGLPRYFATLEVLGARDEDYFLHYDKKTSSDSSKGKDFSRLRAFIDELNTVSDAEFVAWFEQNFDVPKFLSFLVVSNFISNWDGYPQRPKNFWLYQIPSARRWVYIPWDMDGTFQSKTFMLNAMGTDASIFYQFDETTPYDGHPEEGTARPLVRRAMKQPSLRAAYVARYREALQSFLSEASLLARADGLAQLLVPLVGAAETKAFNESRQDIRTFVPAKIAAVTAQLAQQP